MQYGKWAVIAIVLATLLGCGAAAQSSATNPVSTATALPIVLLQTDQASLVATDTDAVDIAGTTLPRAYVMATGVSVTATPATADGSGRFVVHVSGLQIGTNTLTLSATLIGHHENSVTVTVERTLSEAAFKASAQTLPYPQLVKDPGALRGTVLHYKAQVFQYDSRTTTSHMIAAVTDSGYGFWSDNVWLDLNPSIAANVTQKDVVEFWGTVVGPYSYQTAIGGQNTIPEIQATYMTLLQKGS